jgi:alpha-beta hydrolase superfamily lysophospholipase
MTQEEIYVYTQDGLRLFGKIFSTDEPKAVLVVVHGFGEHIDRYQDFASFFASTGIVTIGVDLRGHGRSEGLKGHAPSRDKLLGDIEELLKSARSDYTDIPIFLFGHSMGGGLVLNYAISRNTNEISGVIASAPWVKLAFDPPAWKVRLGTFASSWLPRLRQHNELDPGDLSKDAQVVEAYKNDKRVNHQISARLYTVMTATGEDTLAKANQMKIQPLIYHGDTDRITAHDASKEVAGLSKGTFHTIEGGYHEPHQDIEKEKVYELIEKYIDDRL